MSSAEAGKRLRIAVSGLIQDVGSEPERLPRVAAERLGLSPDRVRAWRILRRSLDARGRAAPHWVYQIGLELPAGAVVPDLPAVTPWRDRSLSLTRPSRTPTGRPVVVGAGPAGLFAALRLTAYGLRPLVLERGEAVNERVKTVAQFWRTGALDPESNVQFGEGGAGTFSDGKLTYRGKDIRRAWVFDQLVEAGAPEEIRFDARPHLGTDRLRSILRRLRAQLTERGAEVRFGTRVDGLVRAGGRAAGVETAAGPVPAGAVFLAPGHSARDLLRNLAAQGVSLEAKGFALGVRVELPQGAVQRRQYGDWSEHPGLPRAEFSVKARSDTGRDVYSFCMCPGGVVIPSGSEPGGVVVNGMSASGRTGRWANAALVVPVEPADAGGTPLAGHGFQREWERRAGELAGPAALPAQTVGDFLRRRLSQGLPDSSSPWELRSAQLEQCLPSFVAEALRSALPRLFRQLPPLEQGLLVGVETRTSSPVRLVRGDDLQSVGTAMLYPVGEGAGYAGGIVSAAIDGVRAADAYAATLGGGAVESEEEPNP